MGCSGAKKAHYGQLWVVAGLVAVLKTVHYGQQWVVAGLKEFIMDSYGL